MLAIDAAAYRSPWRRHHPAAKALLAGGLLGCALLLPPWPGAPVTAAVTLAVALCWARMPPRTLLRAARIPLGFVLTGALTFLVTVGPDGIGWADGGAGRAGEVVARCGAAVLCQVLFAGTTPLADALPRLTRLGLPAALVEVTALVYRLLFVVLDTARRTRQAQAGRLGDRSLRAAWRSLGGLGSAVFVRSFDRARRLEAGLAGRGYTGSLPVVVAEIPLRTPFLAAAPLPAVAAASVTFALGNLL
ncbi:MULTISPECIES: cobalt ECF transporter T component CbiQ [Thermomonospora]|uniref:Cobalt ABC transporter, inner membrane subunit CbiQ n=1 Tax=Thermomonospora curvata (strain ATCC 19995 / DSM 43183 / JCM 3096 / KCTC 9072 / NBRC 15933 / NCIMB 10081 / Henssen B9) TaxID=471852 RepID=D1A737_THECD|nr:MULTISPECIES: cobalt ECF transporter T component CbiQ [Thermomonospora]ACZ00243.1 cobalt ABC transporter, inner membrane subunit CbiQ [Thermomonospora curvata DSM 43183]PKK12045.1 MAG: cobalt ECF transporter T component CbiQ [Thermomonospora sp. CIF 1]